MSPIRRCTRTAIKHNKQNRNLFLIFVVYNAGTINSHVKTSYLCKLCESHLHNFCTTDCSLCFYAEAMLVDCFADHCHCCGNFHYCMDNLEWLIFLQIFNVPKYDDWNQCNFFDVECLGTSDSAKYNEWNNFTDCFNDNHNRHHNRNDEFGKYNKHQHFVAHSRAYQSSRAIDTDYFNTGHRPAKCDVHHQCARIISIIGHQPECNVHHQTQINVIETKHCLDYGRWFGMGWSGFISRQL